MIRATSRSVRYLPSSCGGTRASGSGREGGDFSFDTCMETRNICIAPGDHPIPQPGV